MAKNILLKAPDLSSHNGVVNMKSIRDAGYKNVFLRAGYGKNNIDQKYASNAQACVNLGIPTAIYWFSYALNTDMASKEAEYAIAQAKKYWAKCPIVFDLEYDTVRYAATKGVKIDKALATDMAIAFLKKVAQSGYTPVLYFNRDYKKNYFDVAKIEKKVGVLCKWFALYSSSIPQSELEEADIWQYTSKGKINGVSGNVDINNIYVNLFDSYEIQYVPTPTKNIYILEFQKMANIDGYKDNNGKALVLDGIDGKCTQQVRKKVVLKAKSLFFVGSKGSLVKWWQRRLNETINANLEVDGKFGNTTRLATIEFQKKFGLKPDGIAGYDTIQMAFYN